MASPISTKFATPSVSIPRQTYDRMRRRLPRHGDRSRVTAELWRMFLDGEVKVVIPSRTTVVPARTL